MRCNPGDLDMLEQLADEGYGDFEDYYPASAAGELEASDPFYGRNVIWDAISGRTVRVYPKYARAIDGNIFDADKLAAVRDGIVEAEDRVVMTAPYGTVTVIGLEDVKESIEYADDYPDHVLTTGDDELDHFLVEPDDFDDEEEIAELKAALVEADEDGDGDLGEVTMTFRDGNHRSFGAFLAGEPYVYMMLEENQFQDLNPKFPGDQTIIDMLE